MEPNGTFEDIYRMSEESFEHLLGLLRPQITTNFKIYGNAAICPEI
jgi:hypothetical protein